MTLLPWAYPASGPFYVATTGSDATGDGSSANPWATIQHARDFIRAAALNLVQRADITVNVRAGTYALTAPIAFGVRDSGCNGHRVIYTSIDGPGAAILSGGVQITSWTDMGGGVFRAPLPAGASCYTLYENGVRARQARWPKLVVDPSYPLARAPYLAAQNNGSSWTQLQYLVGDFDPSSWPVNDIGVVIWDGCRDWMTTRLQVSAKDTVGHTLTFAQSAKFYTFSSTEAGAQVNSRYFVEGPQALLSDPGEFYVDRVGGFIYYVPRSTPIDSQTIVCPLTTELVALQGDSTDRQLASITIDGFGLQDTDYLPWFRLGYPSDLAGTLTGPGNYANPRYAYWLSIPTAQSGAVVVNNADGVTLSRLHISQIGLNGIYIGGAGRNHVVRDSLIEHLGVTGIVQEGRYGGQGDIIGGTEFANLKVRNMGELAGHATGIQLGQTGNNTIHYCEFSDGPRHGTWLYGTAGASPLDVYTKGNFIDHVLYERLCQDSGDTAAFYIESLGNTSIDVVNVNAFSQIIINGAAAHPSMLDIPPNGVMTDDNSWGQSFENVQVLSSQGAQFRANNSGGHTLTNTSFMSDGTANPSFNPALMDTANIGVTSAFPY